MIPETLQQNWEEYKAEAFSDPIDAEEEMFRKAIFFDGALAAANMMLEGNKQNGELGLAKTAMKSPPPINLCPMALKPSA